jgi:UTP--glucose-1-phosphate uridylyltransferase
MTSATEQVLGKLSDDGAGPEVLAAMRRRLEQLDDPQAGMLPGDQLEPVPKLPPLDELPDGETARAALDRIAVVKLNGGLGTSMGLRIPKSLVEVKPGRSFLDVVALQVLDLRARHGVRLPLVLMNSFSTRDASLEALGRHAGIEADVPLDFLQSREPKLLADTLEPVEWPANPELEWCPPGHGDLYVSLAASGMLGALLDGGYRWAFVSNIDNLGATVEPRIAAWAEANDVPFVLEAVRGTAADRKGGHLASRDGQLVLRESAQVPDGDPSFGDLSRWHYYNTNNLWVDLQALRKLLDERPSGPDLPLIVNRKTVDPADESSPAVLQLENAMGAAVGSIAGARAVHVPRTRFAPVKTTDDLLVVRSDAYALADDARMVPAFDGDAPPVVTLDRDHYKRVDQLETRFAAGPPSLRACRKLDVHGAVDFGSDVVVEGEVELEGPARIEDGTRLSG